MNSKTPSNPKIVVSNPLMYSLHAILIFYCTEIGIIFIIKCAYQVIKSNKSRIRVTTTSFFQIRVQISHFKVRSFLKNDSTNRKNSLPLSMQKNSLFNLINLFHHTFYYSSHISCLYLSIIYSSLFPPFLEWNYLHFHWQGNFSTRTNANENFNIFSHPLELGIGTWIYVNLVKNKIS